MQEKKKTILAVAACCCGVIVTMGGLDSQFPLYIKPISDDLSLPRNAVSLIASVKMIMTTIVAIFLPRLIRWMGIKRVMQMGAALLTLGIVGYAMMRTRPLLYASAMIAGTGTICIMFVLPLILKQTVKRERRGAVTGFVYAFSGIGGMLFTPLTVAMIGKMGWQRSMLISAGATALLSLIPFTLFIKDRVGQSLSENHEGEAVLKQRFTYEFPVSRFIFLTVTSAYAMSVFAHAPAHFTELSFDSRQIAFIVGMYNIILAGGNILFGILSDRFGIKRIGMICATLLVSFCTMLTIMQFPWQGIIYGVLFGLGAPLLTVGIVLMGTQFIPENRYTHVWSRVVMIQTLTFAGAIWLDGALFDMFGSYRVAFGICTAMAVLTLWGVGRIRQHDSRKKAVLVQEHVQKTG